MEDSEGDVEEERKSEAGKNTDYKMVEEILLHAGDGTALTTRGQAGGSLWLIALG